MTPFTDTSEIQSQRFIETEGEDHFSGLQLQSGVQLFDSPPQKKVALLQAADPRVTYFRFCIPAVSYTELTQSRVWPIPLKPAPDVAIVLDWPSTEVNGLHKQVNSMTAPENLFLEFVIRPLSDYLSRKYEGASIALRGTAAALDSDLEAAGKRVLTPCEILKAGVENGKESVAMTVFLDSGDAQVNFRSLQWLLQHPTELRASMSKEDDSMSKMIFPVLLVYNVDAFPEGKVLLPENPELRESVILEAIILDMPLPYVLQ